MNSARLYSEKFQQIALLLYARSYNRRRRHHQSVVSTTCVDVWTFCKLTFQRLLEKETFIGIVYIF